MEAKDKFTLGLELPTDPRWVDIAGKNIKDILVDHAYCEQKAASSCISLITLFPEKDKLVEVLTLWWRRSGVISSALSKN